MEVRCPQCGTHLPAETQFCPRDGTTLQQQTMALTSSAIIAVGPAPPPAPTLPSPPLVATQGSLDSKPSDPLLGRVLDGRYAIKQPLGAGSMGSVYDAEHVVLKKRVA